MGNVLCHSVQHYPPIHWLLSGDIPLHSRATVVLAMFTQNFGFECGHECVQHLYRLLPAVSTTLCHLSDPNADQAQDRIISHLFAWGPVSEPSSQ